METGGGNRTVFSAVISGERVFDWNGGGNAAWQTTPSFLTGEKPNTFTGVLTILRGTLALAKPEGVSAHAGKQLVLGGGSNQAIVRLDASEQIQDSCEVLITGKHEGRIWTQGHSETVGTLDLHAFGYLDLGEGASHLMFADSHALTWDLSKTLTIQNWTAEKDIVRFGNSDAGLTSAQLARVGFENPSGLPAGLYSARLQVDGQLVPHHKVEALGPPFDVSEQARAERSRIYEVPGLSRLGSEGTPLREGARIAFFGDSITWQNVFTKEIQAALKKGPATKELDIRLFNHGINGGGVLSIRDGLDKAAYVDEKERNGKQSPFAEVIAADKADVAVVFIGINDVSWRNTSAEDFEQALRDLAKAAKSNGTLLVLATLSLHREKPDGSNPKDAICDQYAEITRKVATSTGSRLVDLRKVFLAYLQNHNAELRVDGSLYFLETGVLTYDGVHPNATGNRLLADHLSQGIHDAMGKAAHR